MILIWLVGLIAGLAVATLASRRAVVAALTASEVSRISPGLIGITVMAVGTDLPEIANSIIAALTDHGDVIVGDAAGSSLTQVTFVLALLCFAAAPLHGEPRRLALVGSATVAALLVCAVLVRNQSFTRLDGALLCLLWVAGLVAMSRSEHDRPSLDTGDRRGAAPLIVRTIAWLALVGLAATVVVVSFVELSDTLGVPELIASAVVLSLGTSLPELVVDWTAIRRGSMALALGDLFGSSFLDATLAMGIGPLVSPVLVSADSTTVCLIAAAGVAVATAIMGSRRDHGRLSAWALLLVYVAGMVALVGLAG